MLAGAIALVAAGPTALAAAADYPPATETVASPSTADCPYKSAPWPAVDTSEDLAPGVAAPAPLPIPASPVGGSRLGSCDFVLPDGAPAVPSDISAHAWLVADLTSGQVIGGKDVHGRYRPASTLKLLTMLVMFRNLPDFSQTVTGTQTDAYQEGSRVGIGAGGIYTVNDLMLGLMMNSGNDCANALARTNGGYDKTLADMNAAAAELGAIDTRAATVSGLDAAGQQTSAYDLALFAQADVKLPRFLPMIATDTAMFPGFDTYPAFGMANDNQLLGNYPGALGGKTGFTDDAGNTYVGIAERDGHRLVVTMMGGTQEPRRQWMQGASLLDWGFATVGSTVAPVGTLVDPVADAAAAASSSDQVSANAATSTNPVPTTGAAGSAANSTSSITAAAPSTSSNTWIWAVVAAALLGAVGAVIGFRRAGRQPHQQSQSQSQSQSQPQPQPEPQLQPAGPATDQPDTTSSDGAPPEAGKVGTESEPVQSQP